jgi:hypothetical protein
MLEAVEVVRGVTLAAVSGRFQTTQTALREELMAVAVAEVTLQPVTVEPITAVLAVAERLESFILLRALLAHSHQQTQEIYKCDSLSA